MVHRFWKAAGWLGCTVTGALFVLAFLLCSEPIWPEHFLHPSYSYAQWQTLLAGPHPAGLLLGCGLLYYNYQTVWYKTHMLLSLPLVLALVWPVYSLMVFCKNRACHNSQ